MTKKNTLSLFLAAGLILALVVGVYAYRMNRPPSAEEIYAVIEIFTERISAGNLSGARDLLTLETRTMLRDPGTVLGEAVYRELKVKSIDQVFQEDGSHYAADVVLMTVDTLKVMTKAGILFAEQTVENGPTDDPDAILNEIYTEILEREDLPLLDCFCVIRLENRDGNLQIVMDEALREAVEGGSESSTRTLELISGMDSE